MLNRIKSQNSYDERLKKEREEQEEKLHVENAKKLDIMVMSGDVTQQQIDDMYKNDEIKRDDYERITKKLQDGGLLVSNGTQRILIEKNILSISDDEIMQSDLTNADKIKLLGERRTRLKEANNQWASSVDGREA